jgi:dTDP-4-dehydrorhamnose reductase
MRRPRIVVLGVAGMLGHKVFQLLREGYPGTIGTTRSDVSRPPLNRVSLLAGADVVAGVDVMDFGTVRDHLRGWQPEVTINCVGVIKQRDAAHSPIPSITINSLFPHRLAEAAGEWGGRIVHFSTDCVFSGRRGNYRESDQSDAEDLYGRSKFLGEAAAPNAITLRTSIIGRELTEHRSLLDWFLAQNGKTVRGFRRAIYSGVTTNEMASVVARVVNDHPGLAGVFQVVSEAITKFELLLLIRDAYGLDITVEPDDHEVCDRSMIGERFFAATGWRAPSWPEMIGRLAADSTPYADWGVSVLHPTAPATEMKHV